jgi:hypothetical protein
MFRVTLFSLSLAVVPNTISDLAELTPLYRERFLFLGIVGVEAIFAIILLSAKAACCCVGILGV